MENNTKQRLMIAAIDLFSVKGFSGTSVDEIAESIGIKGPNIYKYFKGKNGLLAEIIAKADEEYEKGMKHNLRALSQIKSTDELKKLTLDAIRFTITNDLPKKMRRIFTIEQFRSELFAKHATFHQLDNSVSSYVPVFKRMMEEGKMVKGDPELFALEYVATATLMIQLCDRDPSRYDYAMKTIEAHMDLFIDRYFINKGE